MDATIDFGPRFRKRHNFLTPTQPFADHRFENTPLETAEEQTEEQLGDMEAPSSNFSDKERMSDNETKRDSGFEGNNFDDEVEDPGALSLSDEATEDENFVMQNCDKATKNVVLEYQYLYHSTRKQNKELLKHLEDARDEHLLEEIELLQSNFPKKAIEKSYHCDEQRKMIIQCYKSNQENPLQCQNWVKQFLTCTTELKRSIFDNKEMW